MFEKIIGNEKNKTILKKALELNKTSHSYLFWGTEGIGKKKIALEFAKKLLCLTPNEVNCRCKACIEIDSNNKPDFMMIEPQDGKVKIDTNQKLPHKFVNNSTMPHIFIPESNKKKCPGNCQKSASKFLYDVFHSLFLSFFQKDDT